jgi:hypothetical protein
MPARRIARIAQMLPEFGAHASQPVREKHSTITDRFDTGHRGTAGGKRSQEQPGADHLRRIP